MKKHRWKGGRKRMIEGKRKPCGLRIPDPVLPTPETLRHRADKVGGTDASRPEAGYALGILYLKGIVTARQHDAGMQFLNVHKRWCILNGIPARHPLCLSEVRTGVTMLPNGDDDRRKAIAKRRLIGAMEAIAHCGLHIYAAVDAVVIDDTLLDSPKALGDLVAGLEALTDYFRIPRPNP